MTARFRLSWDALWWSPGAARTLAGARIVIALHALWIIGSRDFGALATMPAALWSATPTAVRWRYLLWLPTPGWLATATVVVLVAALVAVAIGWRVRASALVAGLLLYHVAPLESALWTSTAYTRGLDIGILSLIVLAASPCGDAWGVDAPVPVPADAPKYQWPVVLIRVFVASIYLLGGWAKFARVGPSWVSAENLRRWLQYFAETDTVAVFTTLGPWIAQHAALCLAAAVGAVVVDLGFMASVPSRAARRIFLPAALMMHAGILVSLNIAFLNVPQLLVFVDWDWLSRQRNQSNATS